MKSDKSILARMSSAIAALVEERGLCTEQDLMVLGFSAAQLLQFGADARARASCAMCRHGRPLALVAEAT